MPRTSNSGEASASNRASVSSMPGSVSMMTGIGKRETGGVGSGTSIRLGCANLLRNHIVQLLELRSAAEAEDALDDPAVAIEQYGVRQAAVVVDRFHPATAHEDRERRPELRDEGAHLPRIHVVRDRRDVEVLAAELAIQRGHVREFVAARVAPGGPEVHQRHAPR